MAKRGRKKKSGVARGSGKRGRKPIFTPAQKSVLERMIKVALAEQLRAVVKGLR